MKTAIFVVFGLVACLSGAFAQTAPRTITMSGQGEVRAAPDMVTLAAGVTSEAATAAGALAENRTHMLSVFAALKKLEVADKDVQTSSFSLYPQTVGGTNGQPSHITSYRAGNEVRVRLDDVSKLGAVLDALVAAGANQMNGINFTIKDSAPLQAEARAGAVADAKAKAEVYAKAAAVSLGPILSISENESPSPRPAYVEQVVVSASRVTPMAAGEESVEATVSIVWEIH